MSILDRIFGEEEEDQVVFGPQEWVSTATAISAHQSMLEGMGEDSPGNHQPSLSRPQYNRLSSINIGKSLQLSQDYRSILIREQVRDIRFTSTGDYVVDGGIKNGSKVVIKIVPESDNSNNSWNNLVKAQQSGSSVVFPHFSVANISQPRNARMQIHETFGADFIQSLGNRPVMINMSGYILNGKIEANIGGETRSMDWKNAFIRQYEDRFSLENCVKNREKIRIFSEDTIWDGYLMSLASNTSAETQTAAQVSLVMVMSDETYSSNNDARIPGFVNSDGFVVTGQTTPTANFPQATLQRYLNSNLDDEFRKEISLQRDQLEEIKERILNKEPSAENLDSVDQNIYFSPASGFSLHEALRGSDVDQYIKDLDNKRNDLKRRIENYNMVFHNITSDEELIEPSDELNFSEFDAYMDVSMDQSTYRNQMSGLPETIRSLNNLCEDYINKKKYIEELEWSLT